MRYDLTCPVEIREWEVLRDDRSLARCYLHFGVLADSAVRAVAGHVDWIDAESGQRQRSAFAGNSLHTEPRGRFTLPVSAGTMPASVQLEIVVESAVLINGEEWRADPFLQRDWPEPPRLPIRTANLLAAMAGRDAVCCASEDGEGNWLCVCGRWNGPTHGFCRRCGRDREETMLRFSAEALEEAAPEWTPPAQVEDPIAPVEEIELSAPRRERSPMRRVLTAVLLAALFACAALGVRAWRYRTTTSAGLMPTSRAIETEEA